MPNDKYFPGSGDALTLTEAASRLAYTYTCNDCGFRERIHLSRVAADFPRATQVGDLRDLLPCGQCGSHRKIVMSLWLSASTTDNMLRERGYPVWPDEDN